MKILHLSAAKNWGGGENHLKNLCHELKEEVDNVVFCVADGILHKRLEQIDVGVITAPMSNQMDPRFFLKLAHICRKGYFDLLHIHDSTALTLAVMADHFQDLPPFIFSKKISFPVRHKRLTLYKYNYPKIQRYLCVSKQTEEVMARSIIETDKLVTIYHGTRLDTKSTKTPYQLREKFNISSEKVVVGNISNHHFSKDLDTFIEVAVHIIFHLGLDHFHFIQIGAHTKLSPALFKKVKHLGLEKHFNFIGHEPQASNFMPQFDIFLLTSTNEGLPQVIYEAFFHQVPVVSTNVAGIPEVVQDGKNGLLAEKGDVENLSKHLIKLSEDPSLQNQITRDTRKLVLENFSTKKMARKTFEQYKIIVENYHN